jgi:D-lactate dehydrogenase (cytochrome)
MALYPGKKGLATDVCVPISRLAEVIGKIRQEVDASSTDAHILGHVGDGNFHMLFALTPENKAEMDEVLRLNESMISHALSCGGTCTGEHGIGTGKLKYMRREHGDAAVAMMQAIKLALDPQNIMNPGKTVVAPG